MKECMEELSCSRTRDQILPKEDNLQPLWQLYLQELLEEENNLGICSCKSPDQ